MHDIHRRDGWAPLYGAGGAVLATLVLTSVHHLYGARRFDTPWRAHVVHIAAWAGVLFGVCLLVARLRAHRQSGRIAMSAFFVLAVAICVLWLGLYEGGYNHGMKNLAYAAQLPASAFNVLFPPSLYEPPGDWFFELSGVLQLPLGLFAGRAAWQAYLASRRS
jgi:hypothetical protein